MKLKRLDPFTYVIDFFSVILPGVLVTYFLKSQFYDQFFGLGKVFQVPGTEAKGWIVFLLASYIFGNIIFLIGSFLLDKVIYDKLMRNRYFKKNSDFSYLVATAIRDQYISSEIWIKQLLASHRLNDKNEMDALFSKDKREIINTFKWAQYFLAIKYPETLIDIKKFEADSRFFRSIVVAFVIIGLVLLVKGESIVGAACFIALSLLCLYRYGELKHKATERAYELIITINHLQKAADAEVGDNVYDDRAKFLASDKIVSTYRPRIAALTKGMRVKTEVVAIPLNETWNISNSPTAEALYCLGGRGIAIINAGNDGQGKIVITPNAIVPLTINSSLQITNTCQEPLILLSVE